MRWYGNSNISLLELWNSIQELNQTFMQIITDLVTGEYIKITTDEWITQVYDQFYVGIRCRKI
jgi:hypothetical protein